jgi:hypothetical protein
VSGGPRRRRRRRRRRVSSSLPRTWKFHLCICILENGSMKLGFRELVKICRRKGGAL